MLEVGDIVVDDGLCGFMFDECEMLVWLFGCVWCNLIDCGGE